MDRRQLCGNGIMAEQRQRQADTGGVRTVLPSGYRADYKGIKVYEKGLILRNQTLAFWTEDFMAERVGNSATRSLVQGSRPAKL